MAHSSYGVLFRSALVPELFTLSALLLILMGLAGVHHYATDDVGGIGSVVLILLRSISYARPVQDAYQQLLGAEPYIDAVRSAADRLGQNQEQSGPRPVPARFSIHVEDVTFSYGPDATILRNLSLVVPERVRSVSSAHRAQARQRSSGCCCGSSSRTPVVCS